MSYKKETPVQSINEQKLVIIENDKPITTSRLIAQTFHKQHAHVLRDIQNLECSKEFSLSNFGLSEFKNSRGKILPEYHISKDGFTMLAMGYTGAKAMQFKESYIKKFNEMERAVIDQTMEPKKLSYDRVFKEGDLFVAKLGSETTHAYFYKGKLWTKLNILAYYLGYNSGLSKQYIERIGSDNIIKANIGNVPFNFINYDGFEKLLEFTKKRIGSYEYEQIKIHFGKMDEANDAMVDFAFTWPEIGFIIQEINKKPIDKGAVINLILKGRAK